MRGTRRHGFLRERTHSLSLLSQKNAPLGEGLSSTRGLKTNPPLIREGPGFLCGAPYPWGFPPSPRGPGVPPGGVSKTFYNVSATPPGVGGIFLRGPPPFFKKGKKSPFGENLGSPFSPKISFPHCPAKFGTPFFGDFPIFHSSGCKKFLGEWPIHLLLEYFHLYHAY